MQNFLLPIFLERLGLITAPIIAPNGTADWPIITNV
jgi:hypothetical protein